MTNDIEFVKRRSIEEFISECEINQKICNLLKSANPLKDLTGFSLMEDNREEVLKDELILKIMNLCYWLYYNKQHKWHIKPNEDGEHYSKEMIENDIPTYCDVYIWVVYCILRCNEGLAWSILMDMSESDIWNKFEQLRLDYKTKDFQRSPIKLPVTIEIDRLNKKVNELEDKVISLTKENEELKIRLRINSRDHFPIFLSQDQINKLYNFLISNSFIAKDTDLDSFLYFFGQVGTIPTTFYHIKWIMKEASKQLLREIIEGVYKDLIKEGSIRMKDLKVIVPNIFEDRNGKSMKLANRKRVLSKKKDLIDDFLSTFFN